MLKGTIKYLDKYTYDVKGIDTSSKLRLVMSSSNPKAIQMMAENYDAELEDSSLWTRMIDVKLSNISIQTNVNIKDDKKVKTPVNIDFFCRLGAILRYVKTHCYTRNIVGFIGLQLASGEFSPESDVEYKIPFETSSEILGNATLSYGNIKSIYIKNKYFEVDLLSSSDEDDEVIPELKDGINKGFAFTEDYLGFPIRQQKLLDSTSYSGGIYHTLEEIIEAHPEKEFEWLRDKNYNIVTDENLQEICDYIYNYDGYVYYDTETTGFNITFRSRTGQDDQCVGIILSVKDGESFYFPMQMRCIKNLCGGDHFYFMEHYIRRILEHKKIVVHNLSFDWKVSYIYDINANIVDDTMAMILMTIGQERRDLPVKLKTLTQMILHRDSIELDDISVTDEWDNEVAQFWDLPYELVKLYACADTDNTRGIHKYVLDSDLLTKYNAHKVYDIEIAFSYAVAYQEFYGHRQDINHIDRLKQEIHGGIKEYYNKMKDMIGHDFNPNSPKQLQAILYGELGIPEQISRKTNRVTTDKETLKHLGELTDIEGSIKYPFCNLLLKYREYEGVRKIVDKFPEVSTADGYIFSKVMQYGTTTGRVSINTPNYQSYNDPVKKNIVPRPGYWMFDTDYSSVEYRVLGNMSGNEMIKKSFYDPDFDYHTYQAARMYRVPYASVTGKLRKAAKGINFGLPYGMGDESLGIRIFGEATPENTRKAAQLRKAYFKGQEDIEQFFVKHRANGVANGFTETYFGRRRYYDKTRFSQGSIRRQAGNAVIQGCMSGDTRIITLENGIIKLRDAVGYNYNVWDGEKWVNGDVLYSGKKQKCIVKFNGGLTIVCSPQHKFLVRSNKGNERFVECKDLKASNGKKSHNAHRVVINQEYSPSDNSYSSEEYYKYASEVHNSNNVWLDDIESRFDIGVVLGRLASDGSYALKEDGYNYITQYVAEHEYNILPELRSCMENLNYVENTKDRSNAGKAEMKTLSVYSISLVKEILDLDIKHKVHDNIFADTEVLRGFLSGFFDGDGGVSGKTITLTFGTQYDFEPMILDLQKALLFFGIRSRYRKYEDRYVLVVRTYDNDRFLYMIGFLNQDKQDEGRSLQVKRDEHVYGKCLIVESVEITDEYIDMYDVCNTDDGYYVADGLIVHNTAADIYKLAVGRVFKRICKEGWLGDVLLSGFIHDELLGEVSNSIDPMKFLKVLREEFEVKITNSDGSPWCPLYMGFGWGMSWYQAKKTEVPIKLQWEFVEKYGTTGYPDWDGDGKTFCDSIPDKIREFNIRDSKAQILDKANQGKEIKPALNSMILDILKEDKGIYDSYFKEHDDFDESYFDTQHIQKPYMVEGVLQKELPKTSDTQEALDIFCMIHDADRTQVNIKSIEDVATVGGSLDYDDADTDDEETSNLLQDMIDSRINTLGMYVDLENHTVYCKIVPPQYMNFIKSKVIQGDNGYKLRFKDFDNRKEYTTDVVVPSENIQVIQDMYISLAKSSSQVQV